MIEFLLDTNICIYAIKRKPVTLIRKLLATAVGTVAVSSITVAELQFGVAKSEQMAKNQSALEQFLSPLEILDFDSLSAKFYGNVGQDLEVKGTPIGSLDTLIGAQALAYGLILVTNNEREFCRIPGLKLQNWTKEDEEPPSPTA